MATTSDKRREVAQRLQEADAERSVPHPIEGYGWSFCPHCGCRVTGEEP
ncbi:hypothetical protein [Olsenella uli]|nr:hypothetical protein [Olsenella uli]